MRIIIVTENYSNQKRAIVVIGNGLIGSSISECIVKKTTNTEFICNIDWNNAINTITDFKNNILKFVESDVDKIDWIWSAGKAGFNATDIEVDAEYNLFEATILMLLQLQNDTFNNCSIKFHLISSAGGLYEGQSVFSKNLLPKPERPYGRLKLKQEKFINENYIDNFLIYRLSTVYSYYNDNFRKGLISLLIKNTFEGKITNIYAKPDTLRDYIWAEDIANFIFSSIFNDKLTTDKINFLVSGKPSTIFEIVSLVQNISKNKVLQHYQINNFNSDKITYFSNIMPENLKITSMDLCVRRIFDKLISC